MLAAILVAGRSAHPDGTLGLMRVTEELDPVRHGHLQTRRLVLPRWSDWPITLPLLVLWCMQLP